VAKGLTEKWVKDHSKVEREKEGWKEGGKRSEKARGWGADPVW
jgi:hypothetical protein